MNVRSHARWRRAVAQHFTEGPKSGTTAALYAHIASCGECARLHERYARAEAALCGTADTVFAYERVGQAVLDRVAPEPRRLPSRALSPWLWSLAVAAAAIVMMVRPPAEHGSESSVDPREYTARGSHSAEGAAVGIRMLRVVPGAGAADGARIEETRSFELDDVVTFTYSNRDPELRYLVLCGIQGEEVRWYYPQEPDSGAVLIAADRIDEPLGDGIRLAVKHREGPLRIVALFSREPLAGASMTEAARTAAQRQLLAPGVQVYTLDVLLTR